MNAHSSVWMSAETHTSTTCGAARRGQLSDGERERCERYFLSLAHRAYGRGGDPSRSKIDEGELRAQAAQLGGTGDAYFEAFCLLRAQLHGKERWAEKTPRHVFRNRGDARGLPGCKGGLPRAGPACSRRLIPRLASRRAARTGLDPEDEAGLAAERAQSKRSYHRSS